MELPELSLETMLGGAAIERISYEIGRALKNMQDPNTDPKAKREVVVKIGFKASESREVAAVTVCCASKLASARNLETQVFMRVSRGGEVRAFENNPNQLGLDFDEQEPENIQPIKKEAASL